MSVFRSRDERRGVAVDREVADSVTPGMRIAAAWSWRILVVAGAIGLFGFVIVQLKLVAIPFLVALLLSGLLVPFCRWLQRHHWPKGLAVAVTEVGVLAIVAGLVTLVVLQVRAGLPNLEKRSSQSYDSVKEWLHGAPLNLTDSDINTYLSQISKSLQSDSSGLLSGALDVGTTAGHLLTGILLVIFTTLFILIDGRHIFQWITGLFPKRARRAVAGAGDAGWHTVTSFVKVQIFVAFVDAVGIGLGAFIIGLFFGGFPLVIPIAVAVFLGSFIPVIGAVLTGFIAVFVALIYLGPVPAVIMLGVVLLVHETENHVLQPFIMGTAVRVHPLAVVLAVGAGGFLAGIPGAFFAVPLVASLNVMITYIARGEWRTDPHPDEKDVIADAR